MKILIIFISFLTFLFSIFLFIFLKTGNFGSKSKILINRIFIKSQKKKIKNEKFEIFFNDFSGFKFFRIKIDSIEKLYMVKLLASFLVFIFLNFLGLFLNRNYFFLSLFSALIFFLLPSEILKGNINKKMTQVYSELPDFIDFLNLLINAGFTFDESIKYLIENTNGRISELFKIYRVKQMEGNSKKEALEYIGKISFCRDFERILKIISESEIVGNPIDATLGDISKEIRGNQRDYIKIKAEKLENNLIFIIFIFIFVPMILLFILPFIPQLKIIF